MHGTHFSRPPHIVFSRHELLNVLAFLLPPLAVKLAGEPRSVALNAGLTLLGWAPGIVHARRVLRRCEHHDFDADQLVRALQHHVRR